MNSTAITARQDDLGVKVSRLAKVLLALAAGCLLVAGFLSSPRTNLEPGPVTRVTYFEKETEWVFPTVINEESTWGQWLLRKTNQSPPSLIDDIGSLRQINVSKVTSWAAAHYFLYDKPPPATGWELKRGMQGLEAGSVLLRFDEAVAGSIEQATLLSRTATTITYLTPLGELRETPSIPEISTSILAEWAGPPLELWSVTKQVGGLSAGLAFALSYVEQLSGAVLTEKPVAATGSIDARGNVSAVGGIEAKQESLEREVDLFFVPKSSTKINATPTMRVVEVENLREAVSWFCDEGNTEACRLL